MFQQEFNTAEDQEDNQATNLPIQTHSRVAAEKPHSSQASQAYDLQISTPQKQKIGSNPQLFTPVLHSGNGQMQMSSTLPVKARQVYSQMTNVGVYQNSSGTKKVQPQRRLTSAKNSKGSPQRQQRPYSAKPTSTKQQQLQLQVMHQNQAQPPPASSLQNHGSVTTIGNIPVKAAIPILNRKNVNKLMPAGEPKQSKEDLYAQALHCKMEANQLREENLRLHTRLSFVESRLAMQDATGNVGMLLKQLNASKQRCTALAHDNRAQQQLLKSTVISEVRAENELYKQELIRLRLMLESGLGGGLKALVNRPRDSDSTTGELFRQVQDLECKLGQMRKFNIEQNKRNILLEQQLTQQDQQYQSQIFELQERLQKDSQIVRHEVEQFYSKQINQMQSQLVQSRSPSSSSHIKVESQSELALQTEHHAKEMRMLVDKYEVKLFDEKHELHKEIKQLKKDSKAQEQKFSEEIQKLKESHEVALFDARVQARQEQSASRVKESQDSNVVGADAAAAAEDELQKVVEKYELQLFEEKQAVSRQMTDFHKKEVALLIDKYEVQLFDEKHELKKHIKQLTTQLKDQKETSQALVDDLQKQVDSLKTEHQVQLDKVHELEQKQVQMFDATLQSQEKKPVVDDEDNYSEQYSEAELPSEQPNQQVTALSDKLAEQQSLNDALQSEIKLMQDQLQEQDDYINKLVKDHRQEIQDFANKQAEDHVEQKQIPSILNSDPAEPEESPAELQSQVQFLTERISEMKKYHKEEINELWTEIEDWTKQYDSLRQEHKDLMQTLLDSQTDYENKINFLEKHHLSKIREKNIVIALFKRRITKQPLQDQSKVQDKDVEQVLEQKQAETDKLKQEIEELQNLLFDEYGDSAQEMQQTRQDLKDKIQSLGDCHKEYQQKIAYLVQQLHQKNLVLAMFRKYLQARKQKQEEKQAPELTSEVAPTADAAKEKTEEPVSPKEVKEPLSPQEKIKIMKQSSLISVSSDKELTPAQLSLMQDFRQLLIKHQMESKFCAKLISLDSKQTGLLTREQIKAATDDVMVQLPTSKGPKTLSNKQLNTLLQATPQPQEFLFDWRTMVALIFGKKSASMLLDKLANTLDDCDKYIVKLMTEQAQDKQTKQMLKGLSSHKDHMSQSKFLIEQFEQIRKEHKQELKQYEELLLTQEEKAIDEIQEYRLRNRELMAALNDTHNDYQSQLKFYEHYHIQKLREKNMVILLFKKQFAKMDQQPAQVVDKAKQVLTKITGNAVGQGDTQQLAAEIENLKHTHQIEIEQLRKDYDQEIQEKLGQLAQARLDINEIESLMQGTQTEMLSLRSTYSKDMREKTMAVAMFQRIVEEINERHAREIDHLKDEFHQQIQEFRMAKEDYHMQEPGKLTVAPMMSNDNAFIKSERSGGSFDRADSAQQRGLLGSMAPQPQVIIEQQSSSEHDCHSDTRQMEGEIKVDELGSTNAVIEPETLKQSSVSDSKPATANEMTSDTMTPVKSMIKQVLMKVKRMLQIAYVKPENIAKFIFDKQSGQEKVEVNQLSTRLAIMMNEQHPADLLAMYLVDVASQDASASGQSSVQLASVTQSQAVEALVQLLELHCKGFQIYSQQKEKKMKLIVGQALAQDKAQINSIAEFEQRLTELQFCAETIDCAIVYLLRMSGNSQAEITSSLVDAFIKDCKKDAYSYSMTGMSFPLQDELLEYSISDDEVLDEDFPHDDNQSDELNDRANCLTPDEHLKKPDVLENSQQIKVSRGGSFDSGRADDSVDMRYEDPKVEKEIMKEAVEVHKSATVDTVKISQHDSQFDSASDKKSGMPSDTEDTQMAKITTNVQDYQQFTVHEAGPSSVQKSRQESVPRSMKNPSMSSVEPYSEPVMFNPLPAIDAHRTTQPKKYEEDYSEDERYSEEQDEMVEDSFVSKKSNTMPRQGALAGETGAVESKFNVNEDLNF